MIPNECQITFILTNAGFLWSKYSSFEVCWGGQNCKGFKNGSLKKQLKIFLFLSISKLYHYHQPHKTAFDVVIKIHDILYHSNYM